MDNLKKTLEVLRKFEGIIHESNFEQFTIDFVQNKEMELNDVISVGEQEGFGEYVRKCGTPTVKQDGKESNLCTWSKGRYLIMLEFDKNGVFLSKRQEVLLKR